MIMLASIGCGAVEITVQKKDEWKHRGDEGTSIPIE
jgi:hypothetical protein